MKKAAGLILVIIIAAAAILAYSSVFTVYEGQQAIITQFGKPVGKTYTVAGLYFKIPFIQDVHYFEKRLLKWDGKPNQIPTRDKKYIWVDTTARWRIVDPLLFLQTVATEVGASSRLDDILDSVVRDLVSTTPLVEIVRSSNWKPNPRYESTSFKGRAESLADDEGGTSSVVQGRQMLTRLMLTTAKKLTPQYGIELVDLQIKRINYVESVQRQVFQRMISERKRIASQYRSEGEGERRRILGTMQKELARIRSVAYKKAQETRGQADAKATDIYGQAYSQDPEFYAIFKTLESYSNLPRGKSEFILSTDGDFWRYLQRAHPKTAQ